MRILIGLLFFSLAAHADISVEYRISPIHGLIKFVYSAADFPHQSENLKELLQRSSYNTPEIQKAIETIKALKPSLFRGIEFHSQPFDDRADGMEVSQFITEQGIYATSIQDLGERIGGMMPLSDHARFLAALKVIEPVYKKLVWDKSISQLRSRKKDFEKIAKKADLTQMFNRAREFYHADWPAGADFIVGLFPIVFIKDFKNQSTGSSFGAVEEYGVMIDSDEDSVGGFGVIFHELSHSLYSAQPAEIMEKLNGYFTNNPSPYQLQAHTWFNEAVATALGNGWAAERAKPKKPDERWYNNPTVQTYAKAIYPLTKSYLEEGKSMDQTYIDSVIKIFSEVLPDSIYNYDGLLNRAILLSDQRLGSDTSLEFRKSFFMQSLSASSPLISERVDNHIGDQSSTLIVMVSDKGFDQLKALAKKMKILERNLPKLKKLKAGSLMSGLDKGRAVIVFKTDGTNDIATLVRLLKEKGKIDREGEGVLR